MNMIMYIHCTYNSVLIAFTLIFIQLILHSNIQSLNTHVYVVLVHMLYYVGGLPRLVGFDGFLTLLVAEVPVLSDCVGSS